MPNPTHESPMAIELGEARERIFDPNFQGSLFVVSEDTKTLQFVPDGLESAIGYRLGCEIKYEGVPRTTNRMSRKTTWGLLEDEYSIHRQTAPNIFLARVVIGNLVEPPLGDMSTNDTVHVCYTVPHAGLGAGRRAVDATMRYSGSRTRDGLSLDREKIHKPKTIVISPNDERVTFMPQLTRTPHDNGVNRGPVPAKNRADRRPGVRRAVFTGTIPR